jgi:rRNA-processing protein FCF1
VVIGDPLQLKHISAVNADEEMAIKNYLSFDENPLVRYVDYSLWDYCRDLITTSKENHKPIVLDCHYRCHPQIIGYSNQMFYEKRLGVTLDVRTTEKNPMLKQRGIIWMDVRGEQRSDAQNINDAEVEKCISIATHLAKQYPEISIGIISPFKHQAQEINAQIPVNLSDRIVADTVHKFQGGERDVIIYSLVVTNNSPATKIRWIDRSVPNLVNVAVTRARTALYIVGNKEYIRAHSNIDLPLGNLVEYTEAKGLTPSIDPGNTFIVDTNIFVQCPNVIDAINPRDNIVIPIKVIDELDKLKVSLSSESLRDNAEKALRNINRELNKRKIREECGDLSCLPQDFSKKNADNLILSIALKFRNHSPILLTNDNGLQVKAKGLGVDTMTLRELVGY